MKTLLVIALSVFVSQAFAFEIKVSKASRHNNLERSFLLKSNLTEEVVLDCQSFIQGLSIGGQTEEGTFFMLGADECQGLYNRIRSSLKSRQKHCIDAEDVLRSDYSC